MVAIVRKAQQRKLIDTDKDNLAFEVRGKPVEIERIHRWMRTHGIASDDLYIQSPPARKYATGWRTLVTDSDLQATPSDVYCRTVSARSTPVPSPTCAATSPALLAQQPSMLSPLRERLLAEVHAATQLGSIGPGAASMDHAEAQNCHDYLMDGSQPGTVWDFTTESRPTLTDGCIRMDYAAPNLPKALGSTAQGGTSGPNGDRTDLPSIQSELEDAFTGAKSTARSGPLQRRAYPEKLLQDITVCLSRLEGLQQILQKLEMCDHYTPALLEGFAELLRLSRVVQLYLLKCEILILQTCRSPIAITENRAVLPAPSLAEVGLAGGWFNW